MFGRCSSSHVSVFCFCLHICVDSKFEHQRTVRALLSCVSQGIPNRISKNNFQAFVSIARHCLSYCWRQAHAYQCITSRWKLCCPSECVTLRERKLQITHPPYIWCNIRKILYSNWIMKSNTLTCHTICWKYFWEL